MKRVYGSRRSLMPNEQDEGSSVKCRERRRRRIEMRRRLASVSAVAGSDNREGEKLAVATEDENAGPSLSAEIMSLSSDKETPTPPVGLMSVVGRAREMEDEISVRTNFCRPEINGYRPVHFFGVFDGHGGHHVSALCKENMHVIMEEELMRVKVTGDGDVEDLWTTAIDRSFDRMDEMAMRSCLCDGMDSSKVCRFHPQLSLVGSTAVVALLTQEYIIVANCGDSRAVLCREGKSVPLSADHKPDREDERARIEACGGRIMFAKGPRVEGVLAMSRAIGDRYLKEMVSSEPEYSITKRQPGDTSLILASDGLWDVLSSEVTCDVVHKCLQESQNHDTSLDPTRSTSAAALLVRLALGRRSTDNISVIVVDLRSSNSN